MTDITITESINDLIDIVENVPPDMKNVKTPTEFRCIRMHLMTCINSCITTCDHDEFSNRLSSQNKVASSQRIMIGKFELNEENFPDCDLDAVRTIAYKNRIFQISPAYVVKLQLSREPVVPFTNPMTWKYYYTVYLCPK